MNDPPDSLRQLQKWMQAAITHPPGLVPGEKLSPVEATIAPSSRQTPAERLAVYQRAYFARLIESLRSLFPALTYALGEQAFDALTVAYLERHPSRSYTLGRLADRFVDFLQEARTAGGDLPGVGHWSEFLIDLARLELAIDQVFDGPGSEGSPGLAAEELQRLTPQEAECARLEFAPGLKLMSFSFPVSAYYTRFRQGEAPPLPGPEATWLALFRRDYVVRRYPLTRPAWQMLAELREGATLSAAIEAVSAEYRDSSEMLANDLRTWFAQWSAAGFFAGIRVVERANR